MLNSKKIAFIGSGNMASSLVTGLLRQQFPSSQLLVCGRNQEKLEQFIAYGVQTFTENKKAVTGADIIVLCVKPIHLPAVCQELKEIIQQKKPVVISVAAGVSSRELQRWLGGGLALLRAMPNTPCTLGAGVIGLLATAQVSEAQKELTESLFRTVGVTLWVTEDDDINKITVLAGSGPGFVFYFMEVLKAAALEMGLSKELAELMTKQMVFGAARMALESAASLQKLCDDVTSKGGTTEAGLDVLKESGFEKTLSSAVAAGLARARFIESQLKDDSG